MLGGGKEAGGGGGGGEAEEEDAPPDIAVKVGIGTHLLILGGHIVCLGVIVIGCWLAVLGE